MRIAIIGRSEVLFDSMNALVERGHEIAVIVTAKDAAEYARTADDFGMYAKNNNVPFFKTAKIKDIISEIQACGPIDIGVSVNYSGIISQSVIDIFPHGILNAHGGDLPRYRGNACQAWAILNGESRIGLCIHSMIGDALDNGDIIARDYMDINMDTKVGEVWDWMHKRVPQLFCDAVEVLEKDPDFVLEVQSKDPRDALRCYPRMPEDGKIDWSKNAEDIIRLINACNKPYAGAFCEWNGQKMIIWDAKLAPEENFLAVVGQVAQIGDRYVDITTGKGKIRVFSVEHDGKIAPPSDFIRSIRTRLV